MKRRIWPTLGLLGMLCVVPAAAKGRKTPVVDPKLGAIGVAIKVKGPTAISASAYASQAFFVKVGEGVDVLRAEHVLASGFSDNNQVYLLNAEPGKYVVVGVYTEGFRGGPNMNSMPSNNIYFDKAMIPATEVTVEPGTIAFMGDIVVKSSVGMKNADEAQNYYGDLIGRGVRIDTGVNVNLPSGATSTSIGIGHLTRAGALVSLARDPAAEREFWTRAIKKVLDDEPDWLELARHRLEAIH